jgi:hypothetical protein
MRQSEDRIHLRRPGPLAGPQIEAEYAELRGFGRETEVLAAFLGGYHCLTHVVDVGRGYEPRVYAPPAAHHGDGQPMPRPGAGGVAESQFQLEVLGVRDRRRGGSSYAREIVGMYQRLLSARPVGQVQRIASECAHGAVVVERRAFGPHQPHLVRHGIQRRPELGFAGLGNDIRHAHQRRPR